MDAPVRRFLIAHDGKVRQVKRHFIASVVASPPTPPSHTTAPVACPRQDGNRLALRIAEENRAADDTLLQGARRCIGQASS